MMLAVLPAALLLASILASSSVFPLRASFAFFAMDVGAPKPENFFASLELGAIPAAKTAAISTTLPHLQSFSPISKACFSMPSLLAVAFVSSETLFLKRLGVICCAAVPLAFLQHSTASASGLGSGSGFGFHTWFVCHAAVKRPRPTHMPQ